MTNRQKPYNLVLVWKIGVVCVGVIILLWPAPHVKENIERWGRKGHEREINKAITLALGRGNAKHVSSKDRGVQF